MLDTPSSIKEIHHMLVCMSCHLLIMIPPLKLISQPVLCINTSQPASYRTEIEKRLLMIPGVRCASLAALVLLTSSSSIFLVVNIRALDGWRIVLVGSCVAGSLAGAPLANDNTFSAESTSAVVFISGGLAHPGWR